MKSRELNRIDRRTAMKRALWTSLGGAIAYNELALGPSLQTLFNRLMLSAAGQSTMDARFLLAEAMRGGPAAFRWSASQALAAAGAPDWAVVHIKVVNHVATNLVFRLGSKDALDKTKTVNASDRPGLVQNQLDISPIIFGKIANAACREHLAARGLGKLSNKGLGLSGPQDTTYGEQFRMNGWFAEILDNPADSVAAQDYKDNSLHTGLLTGAAKFDHNAVGLQVALGMAQTRGGNHALANLKVRANLPDFGYYLADKKIIQSPLGISAFMMGNAYDRAEGTQPGNVVIGAYSDVETAAVNGVPVSSHTSSFIQAVVGGDAGYVDSRGSSSLTQVFDKLVTSDPVLRREMDKVKQDLKSKADDFARELERIAKLESTHVFSNGDLSQAKAYGSMQADGEGAPAADGANDANVDAARAEFLAQVQYTARCLELEGKPVRNFSLFLNMQDVDGGTIDTASFGPPGGLKVRCLSYVEGMRQLAIGLNILAGVIKKHKNVLVLVTAEGGRSNAMGDSECSFGFVMGPKPDVPTRLYADESAINKSDSSQVMDPGLPAASASNRGGIHTYSSSIYFDPSGKGKNGEPVLGDLQAGAIRFLAEKLNYGMSLTELGNFIKIS